MLFRMPAMAASRQMFSMTAPLHPAVLRTHVFKMSEFARTAAAGIAASFTANISRRARSFGSPTLMR